ncbi:hypothetical protein M409DRAFT_24540 [Zasmidium cellare ATCC 36951]|uniref:Uncharacterized protein n=1 Tax=Zasmidium cellare ATCC 36951 TaxID=1080233 RepID=A0A6A6CDL4_ZASCE|nr:uncharacterized protein M409DRAFT_24540 [Zasmidium cellare ATCC 36951]KAF2165151.1 hypothetical protein M409DRAFT_24540 [Zasmidium cellare ATCC 36951]
MLGKYRRFNSRPESSSSPTTMLPPNYPRHPSDIRSVLHWLHRASQYRLPEELLTAILHQANYDCLHITANVKGHNERRSYGPETKAIPYVETTPLRYLKDDMNKDWTGRVRKITLKAKGKDQGWFTNKGTESWSWFEVGRTKQIHVVALEGSGDKVKRGPCWARNPVSGEDWTLHEEVFDVDEVGGEMKEWMESLENGHKISIVPMARYREWRCQVEEASVDVEIEVWR